MRGDFRQRRRAGAADGDGGRAERQIHFREERFHDGLDAARGVGGLDFFKIVRAGEMQQLPVRCAPRSSGSADKTISFKPLAPWLPPMTRIVGAIRIEAERGRGTAAGDRAAETAARTGVPVAVTLARLQPRGGFGKSDERPVHETGEQAVGPAGNGVGFVQKSFRAEAFGGENRRRAGESAHGQDGGGAAALENFPRGETAICTKLPAKEK